MDALIDDVFNHNNVGPPFIHFPKMEKEGGSGKLPSEVSAIFLRADAQWCHDQNCQQGFVVWRAMTKLSCDVCRASLVMDAASACDDQSYHLLTLKNNGGLVVPSEGTVRVIRAAEWAICQTSADRRSQPIKPLEVVYIVRKEDRVRGCVFAWGAHQ